jgi:TPP-dependent pyruvate/acetoin dehydrogenase alpha subunit
VLLKEVFRLCIENCTILGEVFMGTMEKETSLAIFDALLKSRLIEERLIELNTRGEMPGALHSAVGHEAIPIGSAFHLKEGDVFTTARGHMELNIITGMDLKLMFAELYGKATGYCKGKGGDVHLCSPDHRNLAGKGIIGATIPIAAGAALAFKMRKQPNIAMCFFGDGASNQGTFHEGINIASVLKLPVVYICQNNMYAWTTRQTDHMNIKNIADRAASYGIPGVIVDGNDVISVYEVVGDAAERARRGDGPTLIEAKTMRIRGHFEADHQLYRRRDEIDEWTKKDPLNLLTQRLLQDRLITSNDIEEKRRCFLKEIDEAVEFARESPFPDENELMEDIFCNG